MPKYLVTYKQTKAVVVDAADEDAAEAQIRRGSDEEGNEPDYSMEEYISVEVEDVSPVD